MRRPPKLIAALFLALAVCAVAGAVYLHRAGRDRQPAIAPAPAPPAVIPPPPVRLVPDELEADYAKIQRLQAAGGFLQAAASYSELLQALEKAWGPGHADIAPYVYNLALALRLGGRPRESLAVAVKAVERWPEELPLLVLEATLRSHPAIARGAFDARADAVFRAVLAPESLPKLRGHRLQPAELHAQWADMLFRSRRFEPAKEAAEAALAQDPRNRRAREIEARILLALHRPADAIRLLEDLARERSDAAIELCLGMALVEAGQAKAAWGRLEPLLKVAAPAGPGEEGEHFREALTINAARALRELGRPADAVEVIFSAADDPDDAQLLHELASAARALGARGTAAIDLRIRGLQHREKLLQSAKEAQAAGYPGSVPYYRALAALEVDDPGKALARLEEAVTIAPRLPELRLERARVLCLLGRFDLAEVSLEWNNEAARSAAVQAGRALLFASQGRKDEAKRALDHSVSESPPQLRALRARVHLELGSAREAAAELGPRAGEDTPEALLCRAEIAIFDGHDEASEILSGSFQDSPGGAGWARALRQVIEVREPNGHEGLDPPAADASDLLDHPRLFLNAAYLAGKDPCSRLRAAHEKRAALLPAVRGDDGAALEAWHRLLALYRGIGARRKAREVARYLVHLRPQGLPEWRALAQALDAPEEAVARVRALQTILKLNPGDSEALKGLAEAKDLLGVGRGG